MKSPGRITVGIIVVGIVLVCVVAAIVFSLLAPSPEGYR